jgi:hypothetical protein
MCSPAGLSIRRIPSALVIGGQTRAGEPHGQNDRLDDKRPAFDETLVDDTLLREWVVNTMNANRDRGTLRRQCVVEVQETVSPLRLPMRGRRWSAKTVAA